MISSPSAPTQDQVFPPELADAGTAVDHALQSGEGISEALDAFCTHAFSQRDWALHGATFLSNAFGQDVRHLSQHIGSHHLADELDAGSSVLSGVLAAYWDRKEQTERLVGLADEIVARCQPTTDDGNAAEFIAALSSSLAITHPAKSKELLDLAAPALTSERQIGLLEEAREWQMAGQMISGCDEKQRAFWKQELRRKRGNWFWDTDEARDAVRGLQGAGNGSSTVLHRLVPAWAWSQSDEVEKSAPPPAIVPAPRESVEEVIVKPVSATPPRINFITPTPQQPARWSRSFWIAALLLNAATLLLVAMWFVRDDDQPPQTVADKTVATVLPPTATDVAALPDAEEPVSLVAQVDAAAPPAAPEEPADVISPASPAPDEPALAQAPAGAEPAVVMAAQLLPVELTTRTGWVKTPLGLEMQVTAENSKSGRITDSNGMVWQLPPDPGAKAQIKGLRGVVNPYNGETVAVDEAQWTPRQAIPWASTGWSFTLPDALPADPSLEKNASMIAVTKPATTTTPRPGVRTRAAPPSDKAPLRKVAAAASKSKAPAKPKAATAPRPVSKPASFAAVSAPEKARETTLAPPSGSGRSFITRANSIRMTYKNGYWESHRGAYLDGSAESPSEWARDMTLRERSSGTIPKGYVFEVVNNGVVRVVPGLR